MFKAAHKAQKISYYLVEQIRNAILTGEFKPGDRLASEKELTDQFQVSKGSVREAIRVLEVMGLITVRKGIGGGIFAAEVDMNTTIHSLTNFLHFKNVSIADITMFRCFVEPPLAQIAALRTDEADMLRLEKMTDDEVANRTSTETMGIGFHRDLARFSENPLVILLMDFIESLLADIKVELQPGPDFYEDVGRCHYKILECFKRKDGIGAKREMMEHILHVGNHLARLAGVAPFDPAGMESEGSGNAVTDQLRSFSLLNIQEILNSSPSGNPERSRLVLKHIGTGDLYLMQFKDSSTGEAVKD